MCPPVEGVLLARAVQLGAVQGHVTHAVHRVRKVPAPVPDGHVAHHAVNDQVPS